MVAYVDDAGHRIFLVHFYLRPDGSIGGSGKPDPKWLFENGVVYAVESGPSRLEPHAIRQRRAG